MATILVVTGEQTYSIEGDTFHVNKEIGQYLIQAKPEGTGEGNKLRTVASFNCNHVVGIAFSENFNK